MSDIYGRAYHHAFNMGHQQRATCMQEHGAQNPSQTIPWSILQRVFKTQGLPFISPIGSHHHASISCHFVRGTYARAQHLCCTQDSSKASRLPILTGLENVRLVLGKPRHSSVGLTKPRANMSLVQGSRNLRFTLGEAFSITKFHPHGNSMYTRSTLDNLSNA